MAKLLISLFDFTHTWSAPFAADPAFSVVTFDIATDPAQDVLAITPDTFTNVWGVLAAPPCTHFTCASSRFWKAYDADGRTAASLQLITHTMNLITAWKPRMWALENPPGRLRHYLGASQMRFDPWQYAGWLPKALRDSPNYFINNRYRKRTCLWGDFTAPTPRPLDPLDTRVPGQSAMSLLAPTANRAQLRAETPQGFSRAFYDANRNR